MHQITILSQYALQCFHASSIGTVHSIYRKTINLFIGEQLLALQTSGTPLSPLSLITDLNQQQFESLSLHPQDSLLLFSMFSFQNAAIVNLALDEQPLSPTMYFFPIKKALSSAPPIGFVPLYSTSDTIVSSDLLLLTAQKHITDSAHFYHQASYLESAASLVRLLGLGSGLTPSGDDFLCGVLAGLILRDMWQHPFTICLKDEIRSHLSDTNTISQAFLKCALLRQFSLAVCNLKANPDYSGIIRDFSSIGHSSGMDTLCGIYFALNL